MKPKVANHALSEVISHEFFDLELRPDGIVWLSRKPVLYRETRDIHGAYDKFLAAVDDWVLKRRILSGDLGKRTRTNFAWLYDIRSAPTQRNDPEFEAAILARSPDLARRSPMICILVGTSTGRMQVTRLSRGDVIAPHIDVDFDASIKWLHAQLAAAVAPRSASRMRRGPSDDPSG